MTLKELAKTYEEAAVPLRARLRELRYMLQDAEDPEEIWHIKRRIKELTPMLTDMYAISDLLEHYYDVGGGWDRNRKYAGFNGKSRGKQKYARQEDACIDSDIIGKESVLSYAQKRMEDIQQDARNAAQVLESIEKMLYLADEYTRYKTKYVESSVNSLFRIARFRLFREQANGGVEERCDVVYDGVPYVGLNNGMKINVGIDIINSLSRHFGVTVPLFVDNAEGVTRLEQFGGQVIRLVVSESDKELRCANEN